MGELKDTFIRNQRRWVGVREHGERVDRLECARLVFPYRKHCPNLLMDLEHAEKVEYIKGTGLWKQRYVSDLCQVCGSFHQG